MSSELLLKDHQRLARRAAILRPIAASSAVVVAATAVLFFAFEATAIFFLGLAVCAFVIFAVVMMKLSRTRATLHTLESELRVHG